MIYIVGHGPEYVISGPDGSEDKIKEALSKAEAALAAKREEHSDLIRSITAAFKKENPQPGPPPVKTDRTAMDILHGAKQRLANVAAQHGLTMKAYKRSPLYKESTNPEIIAYKAALASEKQWLRAVKQHKDAEHKWSAALRERTDKVGPYPWSGPGIEEFLPDGFTVIKFKFIDNGDYCGDCDW